jgi:hypothetical protein
MDIMAQFPLMLVDVSSISGMSNNQAIIHLFVPSSISALLEHTVASGIQLQSSLEQLKGIAHLAEPSALHTMS